MQTDPFALLAQTYAVALLLGGITLRTADWPPEQVVVDHDQRIIMISRNITRWRYVSDAICKGLEMLSRGRSIALSPNGHPVWAGRRVVGDDFQHDDRQPPEDPPSSPRLRIVRDA